MIYIDRLLMQQLILSFSRLAIVLSVLRLTGFDSTWRVSLVEQNYLPFRNTCVHPRFLVGFVLLDL